MFLCAAFFEAIHNVDSRLSLKDAWEVSLLFNLGDLKIRKAAFPVSAFVKHSVSRKFVNDGAVCDF